MFAKKKMRAIVFFCDFTQRWLVAGYTDVSGQYICPILKGLAGFFFGLLVL